MVSPILFAGVLAEIIGEGLERLLAWVALIWLLALIAVVTPYRVWREANVEISDLKSQLDTKEKRTAAMRSLGETWECAMQFLNDLAPRQNLTVNEHEMINEFSERIYESVEIISPSEVYGFRTVGIIEGTQQFTEVNPILRTGDKTLLIFDERLKRVQEFINKHSPPEAF